MKIVEIFSLTEVAHQALVDIEMKAAYDDNGNVMSNYYALMTGDNGEIHSLSVAVVKDDGDGQSKGWYLIHVIDDINGTNCELRCTESQNENELLLELSGALCRALALVITA